VCTFSPSQITASATAPSVATLTIQTATNMALRQPTRHGKAGVASALLLPFASVLLFYRRRSSPLAGLLGLFVLCGVTFATLGTIMGCGGSAPPSTPAGTSQVVVTATSGSISQSTTISLTVQ
jgi:hypothetical protein